MVMRMVMTVPVTVMMMLMMIMDAADDDDDDDDGIMIMNYDIMGTRSCILHTRHCSFASGLTRTSLFSV